MKIKEGTNTRNYDHIRHEFQESNEQNEKPRDLQNRSQPHNDSLAVFCFCSEEMHHRFHS